VGANVIEKTDANSLGAALLDWNDGLQEYRNTPDQTELPFMCLTYGMEEAAKHPVPAGKYAKVPCVHKSVPRIIGAPRRSSQHWRPCAVVLNQF
jgi:hypothetical protein